MDIVVDAGKFLQYVYKKGSARTEQVGSFSGNDASVFKTFKKLGVQLTSEAVNERQILS